MSYSFTLLPTMRVSVCTTCTAQPRRHAACGDAAAARRHCPHPCGPPPLLWAVSSPQGHSVWTRGGEGGGVSGF